MRLDGQQFTNSNTCQGVSFGVPGAPIDLAEITITGRYPEQGWARNLESHEMVRILSGTGKLLLEDGESTALQEGDVVHVSPKAWFAWEGQMVILIACGPAFDPEKYEIKGGQT